MSDAIIQAGECRFESGERLVELGQVLRHFLIQILLTGLQISPLSIQPLSHFPIQHLIALLHSHQHVALEVFRRLTDRPGQLVEARIHLGILRFETFLKPHITSIGIRLELGRQLFQLLRLLFQLRRAMLEIFLPGLKLLRLVTSFFQLPAKLRQILLPQVGNLLALPRSRLRELIVLLLQLLLQGSLGLFEIGLLRHTSGQQREEHD